MNYRLINQTTGEEHICSKMEKDGMDYYVIEPPQEKINHYSYHNHVMYDIKGIDKKIIATNNPNIDVPKMVDEVERFIKKTFYADDGINFKKTTVGANDLINGFKQGYNKSQETHPNSDEDIVEFAEWIRNNNYVWKHPNKLNDTRTTKELLDIWKEQKLKIVYYN